MQIVLDLSLRHWEKTRHGITAIGTWLRQEDGWRPCMVLIRAGGEYDPHSVPCTITVDQAFHWEPSTAISFEQTMMKAIGFCDALRLSLDRHTVVRLMDFVNDFLSDLISMPPLPESAIEPTDVAHITMVNHTTGRSREVELTDV